MTTVNEVVDFWLDEVGADRWYAADEALDHEVRRRFEQLWWDTLNGANGLWLTYASGTLAYLILMDQMPRNMFRGQRGHSDRIGTLSRRPKRHCIMAGI
jgi:uncharacterized protein (DUF924 family)